MLYASLTEKNILNRIGKNAFKDCTNLISFYFGNNVQDWYVWDPEKTPGPDPKVKVEEDLSDKEMAVIYLTSKEYYLEKEWTKSV